MEKEIRTHTKSSIQAFVRGNCNPLSAFPWSEPSTFLSTIKKFTSQQRSFKTNLSHSPTTYNIHMTTFFEIQLSYISTKATLYSVAPKVCFNLISWWTIEKYNLLQSFSLSQIRNFANFIHRLYRKKTFLCI